MCTAKKQLLGKKYTNLNIYKIKNKHRNMIIKLTIKIKKQTLEHIRATQKR